jgi:hypothetical protein
MSALGMPQVAIVHGISVAGMLQHCSYFSRLLIVIARKVVPTSLPWPMKISSSGSKVAYS